MLQQSLVLIKVLQSEAAKRDIYRNRTRRSAMRASVIVSELSHDKSVSMAALNGFIRELSSSWNRAVAAERQRRGLLAAS